jgi:hypothetical protein
LTEAYSIDFRSKRLVSYCMCKLCQGGVKAVTLPLPALGEEERRTTFRRMDAAADGPTHIFVNRLLNSSVRIAHAQNCGRQVIWSIVRVSVNVRHVDAHFWFGGPIRHVFGAEFTQVLDSGGHR